MKIAEWKFKGRKIEYPQFFRVVAKKLQRGYLYGEKPEGCIKQFFFDFGYFKAIAFLMQNGIIHVNFADFEFFEIEISDLVELLYIQSDPTLTVAEKKEELQEWLDVNVRGKEKVLLLELVDTKEE